MSGFSTRLLRGSLLLLSGVTFFLPLPAQETAQPVYLNPKLPLEQRVDDLIGRMTLEEKVEQMRDHSPAIRGLALPSTTGGTRACMVLLFPATRRIFRR